MTNYKTLNEVITNTELLSDLGSYINGQWIKDEAKGTFPVTDPATHDEKILATIPNLDVDQIDVAIDAGFKEFYNFKDTTIQYRSAQLMKLYDLIIKNKEDLAKLIVLENGKSMFDATSEVNYGASYFKYYAEYITTQGATNIMIQPTNPNNKIFTKKCPVGLISIITPWNFPFAMITRKLSAALAVGCTSIIKPDSQTPLSAIALVKLIDQLDYSPGVVNLILAAHEYTPEFGLKLCESPKIKKLTFTGSTRVGKILMKQCSDTMKKLSFELGGNAPFIVCENVKNLEYAVDQAIAAKFRGLGQTCVCANIFYIHEKVLPKFIEILKPKVEAFVIGHGLDKTTTHGSLINESALNKTNEHVEDALYKGASSVVKGGALSELGKNFYAPTVLTNVSFDSKVCHEETFGPLMAIVPFTDVNSVIAKTNQNSVGLASYVFNDDINELFYISEQLESGMVSCNTGLFSDVNLPFGGIKESGFGKEGSVFGLDDFVVIKSMILGLQPISK
ncbi:aldehyde dehydrogenase [Hanseniaspora valbyensis NRRL Y-1626]|uniref:Aldehyde dehydrogenase n=1 Tax=Hanseniaspora valbyensis NRRL Y-1626 TaxID=766949 RepID=A0A1B7T7I6_9ASCO|nr:aldehyde dehydrogenase [Hanseniaspora valbyensis NRRL Y-1626]